MDVSYWHGSFDDAADQYLLGLRVYGRLGIGKDNQDHSNSRH